MQSHGSRNILLNTGQSMPVLALWAMNAAVQLIAWDHRQRSRKALGQLEDHMLRDIGLTSSIAFEEADKPFWKG
jgi:uncharacterized protein YjiS (DUF1127 family)